MSHSGASSALNKVLVAAVKAATRSPKATRGYIDQIDTLCQVKHIHLLVVIAALGLLNALYGVSISPTRRLTYLVTNVGPLLLYVVSTRQMLAQVHIS